MKHQKTEERMDQMLLCKTPERSSEDKHSQADVDSLVDQEQRVVGVELPSLYQDPGKKIKKESLINRVSRNDRSNDSPKGKFGERQMKKLSTMNEIEPTKIEFLNKNFQDMRRISSYLNKNFKSPDIKDIEHARRVREI